MALILNVYMGLGKSLSYVLWQGMILFLPFDALKIVVTALLAKPLVPAIQRINAGSRHYA
jgi:biotin transporter BioY